MMRRRLLLFAAPEFECDAQKRFINSVGTAFSLHAAFAEESYRIANYHFRSGARLKEL